VAFINGATARQELADHGYYYNIASGNFEKTPTQEDYLKRVAEVAGNIYDDPNQLHGLGTSKWPPDAGASFPTPPDPFKGPQPTQAQGPTAEQVLTSLKAQGVSKQDFSDSIVAKEKAALDLGGGLPGPIGGAAKGSLTSDDKIRAVLANLIAPPPLGPAFVPAP